MNSRILIVIPSLYQDFVGNVSLFTSLGNLYEVFGDRLGFYIVIQGVPDKLSLNVIRCKLNSYRWGHLVELIIAPYRNVSRARNQGIKYAIEYGYSKIIFHDASVFYPKRSAIAILNSIDANRVRVIPMNFDEIIMSDVCSNSEQYSTRMRWVDPIRYPYLASYVFNTSEINKLFIEEIGLGDNTSINCGEDTLFILSYFGRFSQKLLVFDKIRVVHSRRLGYEKHATYARGQGSLYRYLLCKEFNLIILLYVIAFIGNALLRLVLLRDRSWEIICLRLNGLFRK